MATIAVGGSIAGGTGGGAIVTVTAAGATAGGQLADPFAVPIGRLEAEFGTTGSEAQFGGSGQMEAQFGVSEGFEA